MSRGTRGALAAFVLCMLLAPQALSAPAHGKSTRALAHGVAREPINCVVKPEDADRENQSRASTQLSFNKGRPFVAPTAATVMLSRRFCVEAGCAGGAAAGKGVNDRLIKRLNLSLGSIRYFDQIAREPLFPDGPPDQPEDPGEDASDDEKESYKAALKAYEEKQKLVEHLTQVLHRTIDELGATKNARAFSGTWADFFKNADADADDGPFERWRREVAASNEVQDAFRLLWQNVEADAPDFAVRDVASAQDTFYTRPPNEVSEKSFESDLLNSFLIFVGEGTEPGATSFGSGQICFRISDPVNVGRGGGSPNFSVAPAEAADNVRQALREARLVGVPWSPEEVGPAVVRHYEARGYGVHRLVSRADDAPRNVSVLRQRISLIRMPQMTNEDAFKVLQRVLPRESFEALVKNEMQAGETKYLTRTEAASEEMPAQIMLRLRTRTEDDAERLAAGDDFIFVDEFTLNRVGAALGAIHYGLSPPQSNGDDRANLAVPLQLLVVKLEDKEEAGQNSSEGQADPTPADATPTPTPADAQPTPASSPSPTPTPESSPTPSPLPTPSPTPGPTASAFDSFLSATLFKVCPRFNNLFYAGIDRRPGQGTRAVGGYKCLRAGPGVAGLSAGEDGAALGSLSYSAVIPFFGTGTGRMFRRPLTLSFDAASEYEQQRLFNGVETNERRRGGGLRAVLPLRPPAEHAQFDLSAEIRRQTVDLNDGANTLSKLNLTTLDLGARFFLDRRTATRPGYLELIPNLKLGLGVASREPTFARFTTTAALHRELTHALDVDVRGRVAIAGVGTPVFERPSFGSPDTVRGFRRDDAIGLRMWSLQPELWLRGRGLLAPSVNPLTGEEGGLRSILRESLSLALFYDVGGVYRTLNSPPGARSGLGAGLRFTYKRQATIKLDWAYGMGERATGRRRLRFYLTFELPENPL